MEVIVKNCLLSKTHISKMAYNSVRNILACNIDGNDTILFFKLDSTEIGFSQTFKGMSKPPGSKISMSWSPDGRYLALGAGNMQIWELKEDKLKPIKSFHENFVQIKIVEWSVDSQNYACGGISQQNSIKIRNIQSSKLKQLALPQQQTISAISFDPYGKYLFLLLRNNRLQIYSVINYQKQKSISLSPDGLKINPIKQIRAPSWSPDFNYFVCPSLDDSRINIAINLSRSKDFKSKNIFLGHCTSISCCKFNPKLYKWNDQITSIVAMGDSAGNVSIWRVGSKMSYSQPLLLSNSLQNSMEVVEDIQWDEKGDVLMINMMKKYIHTIKFVDKKKDFGIQLLSNQVFSLIQQTFGSNRATDVNNKEIQIFDAVRWDEMQEQNKIDQIQPNQIIQQKNEKNQNIQIKSELFGKQKICEIKPQLSNCQLIIPQIQAQIQQKNITLSSTKENQLSNNSLSQYILPPAVAGESKNEYIKLSEQKTIFGKNNKKRIQPAMMIRKDEINSIQLNKPLVNALNLNGSFVNMSNTMNFSNSMVQTFPSLQLPQISFLQKHIPLPKHRFLQIRKLSKATSLELIDLLHNNEYIARRIFPSIVDYVSVTDSHIYVINQQFLYIFDLELNPKQLPLKIGQIHKFLTNNFGEVYYINCDGYLIGFNHLKSINKTLLPVPLHLLLKQATQTSVNNSSASLLIIKQFTLSSNSQIFITVQSEKGSKNQKRQRYLYDNMRNGWVKLDFKQGILESGFSIKITETEQNIVKNFFKSICPSLRQKWMSQNSASLPKQRLGSNLSNVLCYQEESMIYYSKYQKDVIKYQNSFIEYFQSLKISHKNNQFRSLINQYFYDASSLNYISDKKIRQRLWQRIKKQVNGNIIEQFRVEQAIIEQQ